MSPRHEEHQTNIECPKCKETGYLQLIEYRGYGKNQKKSWYGNLCEHCGWRNTETYGYADQLKAEKKEARLASLNEFVLMDWAIGLAINKEYCQRCPLYCRAATIDDCRVCHDKLVRRYVLVQLKKDRQEHRYDKYIEEIRKRRAGDLL